MAKKIPSILRWLWLGTAFIPVVALAAGSTPGGPAPTIPPAAPTPAPKMATDATEINALIHTVSVYVRIFAYGFSVIMIVYAGILYFTANNDPSRPTQAKAALKAVVIGLTLVVLSELIIRTVLGFVTTPVNQSGIANVIK